MSEPLLAVRNLAVEFRTDRGTVKAVQGVGYDLRRGETLAVVGESGSGKSVSAMAILGLLPPEARTSGTIVFDGVDLSSLSPRKMRKVRGNRIAMIFQDPMTALNPVFTVGHQLIEAVRIHRPTTSKSQARVLAVESLELVGIPDAVNRMASYPHELSGGMRQRVMIAMAMVNEPDLLIADEPTTALDVTIQAQVIDVIKRAQRATGAALMLITHDLGLVAGVADRVQVMYAGQVFETGDIRTVFYATRNPYTRGLLTSIPSATVRSDDHLEPIPGAPPSPIDRPAGCAFRPRCSEADEACWETPELLPMEGRPGHLSRCHHAGRLPAMTSRTDGQEAG